MPSSYVRYALQRTVGQVIDDKLDARGEPTRRTPPAEFVWPDELPDQAPSLTQRLKVMLSANDGELAKVFVTAWLRQACSGNQVAMRELLQRVEGGPEIAE